MAISLRSTSQLAYATRTNTTVSAPAGATAGDVVVVALGVGGSASTPITPPAGWTQIQAAAYTASDPWWVNVTLWVKAHDGAGSWTWTHLSRSSQAVAMAWTGVDTTTPLDAPGTSAIMASLTGLTATAPSLTTTTAGARLIIARGSWDGNAIAPPAGWGELHDTPVLWVGERDWPTPSATGAIAVPSGNGGASSPWGIIMGALRPAGTGPTVHAASGTVAITSGATGAITAVLGASGQVAMSTSTAGAITARLRVAGIVVATSAVAGAATRVPRTHAASGTVAFTSGASGSVSVIGGPVTHSASGTVAMVTGAAGQVTARLRASGTVAITSGALGSVALISAPVVHQASGTVALTSGTAGTVTYIARASGVAAFTSGAAGAISVFNPAATTPAPPILIASNALPMVVATDAPAPLTISSARPTHLVRSAP